MAYWFALLNHSLSGASQEHLQQRLGKIHADIGKLDTPCLFQAIPLFRELRIPLLPESFSVYHWYVAISLQHNDEGRLRWPMSMVLPAVLYPARRPSTFDR
jgi:hypothetical protein